jgi:hypothetical protein
MLRRLKEWIREARRPPTMEEVEARKDAQRLLEEKETVRVLDRYGPEGFTTDRGERD